ncbi:MAG TPA: DGQHR domain-containing protein, partial [Longimicrobiaceae bacterium]
MSIPVILGRSADRDVLLGCASASVLAELSFADVLDEGTGQGYQRRFNPAHSRDFRRYIQKPGSTTIPLTFNLRPPHDGAECAWRIVPGKGEGTRLVIRTDMGRPLSQVDCQHRLGRISDLDLLLPFMSFVGLTEREELEIFSIINSKAKGLRGSLLDYHAARLTDDLAEERPELYVALYLHESERSPWHQQLDLGGKQTVGLARRASLRTMQRAVKRFLSGTGALSAGVPTTEVARVVLEFWQAVAAVLPAQWANPRKHFLNKGVGVYALMGLLTDMWNETAGPPEDLDRAHFESALGRFSNNFDWSTSGPLKGLGGES